MKIGVLDILVDFASLLSTAERMPDLAPAVPIVQSMRA
jgi:hypothetical protein